MVMRTVVATAMVIVWTPVPVMAAAAVLRGDISVPVVRSVSAATVRAPSVTVRILGTVSVMVAITRARVSMSMAWVATGAGMRKIARNGDSVGILDGTAAMMRVRWRSRSSMLATRLMSKSEVGISGLPLLMERTVIFLNL